MLNWTLILENLGIFGLITGAIAWLLKALGQDVISRRFSAYEKELNIKSKEYQAELNSNLETHKAKLNIEHTQYLKLHEKRLEVMTEIYKRLAELDRTMYVMTAIMKPLVNDQTPEEQDAAHIAEANKAYIDFQTYYLNHKIFFNESNCELLEKLKESYWDSLWDGSTRHRMGNISFKHNYEAAKQASKTVREHIPPIKISLEKEFRLTLGVK